MIETHEIPDGIMLVLEPFNAPNRNSACKVIAEIKSTRPERRDVRFRVCELRNLINTGYLIIKAALERKESIGLHYSIDYPRTRANEFEVADHPL